MTLHCDYCKKEIWGGYITSAACNYHTDCFHNHIEIKCTFCGQGITGQYLVDDWGNRVCGKHTTGQCDSCGRIVEQKNATVTNSRCYCSTCAATSVTSHAAIIPLYKDILKVYNQYGFLHVPDNVPVELVDKPVLMARTHSKDSGSVLGLAETTTRTTGPFFSTTFEHRIFLYKGMPKLETEAVLAHELLHTWLNQYNIRLPDPQTEGFCNLGSYLILALKGTHHAQVLLKRIKEDPDPVYGGGFRAMLAEVQRKGWVRYIGDVRGG